MWCGSRLLFSLLPYTPHSVRVIVRKSWAISSSDQKQKENEQNEANFLNSIGLSVNFLSLPGDYHMQTGKHPR